MGDVILTIDVDATHTYEEFIVKMEEIGFTSLYQIRQVALPAYQFRDEFIDHIAEHGMSSLLNYSMTMEDITSPSMSVDDVESAIANFIEKLRPLNRLLVIDPYFYAASTTAHELFQRLLAPHQAELNEVTVICKNTSAPNAAQMRAAISAVAPAATVNEVKSSEFHDRFWINPDSGCGLVMGTSLNGIGKKIALVDRLASSDVQEILALAKAAGYAG